MKTVIDERRHVQDANFANRGMERTPVDQQTMFIRGEGQRQDPMTPEEIYTDVTDDDQVQSILSLIAEVEAVLAMLKKAQAKIAADAKLRAKKAQDSLAATRNKHKKADALYTEAFYAQRAATGDHARLRTYWDKDLGMFRPDRDATGGLH